MRPDLNHFLSPRPPGAGGDISQQLRDLPTELAPPYDWAEFRRRSRNRVQRKSNVITWPHAAAAAGLTAVVAAMAMLGTGGGMSTDDGKDLAPSTVRSDAANDDPMGSTATPAGTARGANTDAVTAATLARETRDWLSRQPDEPVVVRAGPRIVVANLEDRIAWFDDVMTDERLHGASSDRIKVLQQERARLVSSLAQVRYAETLVADGS